jgi:hypothetical protein
MLKIGLATPQTHVKHGVLDAGGTVSFLAVRGVAVPRDRLFNTAREIYDALRLSAGDAGLRDLAVVCAAARDYAATFCPAIPVVSHLVSYEGEVLVSSE